MAVFKCINSKKKKAGHRGSAALYGVIRYCENPGKTEERKFVSGVGCFEHTDDELDAKTAWKEFLAIDATYDQLDETKRFYAHYVQSFAPGELTEDPDTVHAIGEETAQRLWPGHQVLVATHVDHNNHIHNHFIVNTVSYEDGKKIHTTKQDLESFKKINDEICQKHGLSTPQKGKHHDGSKLEEGTVSAYSKDKFHTVCCGGAKSYVSDCYEAYKAALATADSRVEFESCMQDLGWTVSWTDTRKNISFEDKDGHRVRDTNLAKTFNDPISKSYLESRFSQKVESAGDRETEEIGTIRGKVICQEYQMLRYASLDKEKERELAEDAKSIARAEKVIKDTKTATKACQKAKEQLCRDRDAISPIRVVERKKLDQQITYQELIEERSRQVCKDTLQDLGYGSENAVIQARKQYEQKQREREKIHERWKKVRERQEKAIDQYAKVFSKLADRVKNSVMQKCRLLREKMDQTAMHALKKIFRSRFEEDRFYDAVRRADRKLNDALSSMEAVHKRDQKEQSRHR